MLGKAALVLPAARKSPAILDRCCQVQVLVRTALELDVVCDGCSQSLTAVMRRLRHAQADIARTKWVARHLCFCREPPKSVQHQPETLCVLAW